MMPFRPLRARSRRRQSAPVVSSEPCGWKGKLPSRNCRFKIRGKNGRLIRDESLRINRTVDNGIANVFVYLAQAPNGTTATAPPQPFILSTDATAFSPREASFAWGRRSGRE